MSADVPEAIGQLATALAREGRKGWLVGPSLASLVAGSAPPVFEIAIDHTWAGMLERHPGAVVTRPEDRVARLPTAAGPVDLWCIGSIPIAQTLRARTFTFEAMALPLEANGRARRAAPAQASDLLDPHGGLASLTGSTLACVGPAKDTLGADPLQAIRAARICAVHGLEPDEALESALAATQIPIQRRRRNETLRESQLTMLRREFKALLLSSGVERGLSILRRTGLEAQLAQGTRADAGAICAALPQQLEPRLVAWLREAKAGAALRRLRFGRPASDRALALLDHHPLGSGPAMRSDADAARLFRRLSAADLGFLFELRELELTRSDPGDAERGRSALAKLRAAFERVKRRELHEQTRRELALGGEDLMEILDCRPGRRIGRAMDYLASRVLDEPAANTEDRLKEWVLAWAEENPE